MDGFKLTSERLQKEIDDIIPECLRMQEFEKDFNLCSTELIKLRQKQSLLYDGYESKLKDLEEREKEVDNVIYLKEENEGLKKDARDAILLKEQKIEKNHILCKRSS